MLLLTLLLACAGEDSAKDADGDGATSAADCDDADAAVHPDAPERCDGADNDCDGEVDEDAADAEPRWADPDGDGYGSGEAVTTCPGSGWSAIDGDCDEEEATVHPGVVEVCDGVDQDCDGLVDDEPADGVTRWVDADGDGWGDTESVACASASGFADQGGDCDDADAAVNPDATEVCNGVDDDCDDAVDDAGDVLTVYADADGDGFGTGEGTEACTLEAGWSESGGDCDDGDAAIHPAAVEVCDGADDDCDGAVDAEDEDVSDAFVAWTDADGDGYGAEEGVLRDCDATPEGADNADDCDDADATVNPAAAETCATAVDDDCDGLVNPDDPSLADGFTAYADADGDGFGEAATAHPACVLPAGEVRNGDDCDDTEATVKPGAAEICNGGVDDNCNGSADDDDVALVPSSTRAWYADADADGYGAGEATMACEGPAGSALTGDDCDDADPAVSPGADEVCDELDDDCDALVDEEDPSLTDGTVLYRDRDGDGVGDDASSRCDPSESGWSTVPDDCDDTDDSIWSGCTEPVFTESFDVVVVGSGPAGLAAALSAREMGASVLLVERAESAGTGAVAGQGLMAAGTVYQAAEGVSDTPADLVAEWEEITGVSGEQEGVQAFVESSGAVIDWLVSYGYTLVRLSDRPDMGSVSRMHELDAGVEEPEPWLVAAFDGELRTEVEVTGPVMWEDEVVGVHLTDLATGSASTVGADAVVLATGGFQRDEELLLELIPGLSSQDWVYECILEADGGGLPFTDLVGAAYENQEVVGVYSHAIQDPYGADHEALTWYTAGKGVIVGEDGARFSNEDETSAFAFYEAWPEGDVFAIIDGTMAENAALSRPFYNWADPESSESHMLADLVGVSADVFTGDSLPELAAAAGIDPDGLVDTVDAWNETVDSLGTDPFGRDVADAAPVIGPDYHAVRLYAGVAKSFGGVQTSTAAEVLDEDGVAIPGLYAAGEAAGMLPGGGSGAGWGGSVAGCYYGGRIAGQEAATYAASR